MYLRPSNNPLLRAPKNSTQFIIDDHESSQHFLDFRGEEVEGREGEEEEVGKEQEEVEAKPGPDDDHFWTEYSERDFESVYETAHQVCLIWKYFLFIY